MSEVSAVENCVVHGLDGGVAPSLRANLSRRFNWPGPMELANDAHTPPPRGSRCETSCPHPDEAGMLRTTLRRKFHRTRGHDAAAFPSTTDER